MKYAVKHFSEVLGAVWVLIDILVELSLVINAAGIVAILLSGPLAFLIVSLRSVQNLYSRGQSQIEFRQPVWNQAEQLGLSSVLEGQRLQDEIEFSFNDLRLEDTEVEEPPRSHPCQH